MTDIDDVLRESLGRLAVPGDPTGVGAAIRARVDAGDPGTPGKGSDGGGTGHGPGGGRFGGMTPWLPWLGLVVVAGVVGGLLGLFGVFGRPAAAPLSFSSVLESGVAGLDCPAGSVAASFPSGERVLAVSRSADSAYLGVRDPSDRSRTVWVLTTRIVADPNQVQVAKLPVAGCAVPTVSLPGPTSSAAPSSTPSSTPTPHKTSSPKPPATPDTTPPVLGKPSSNRSTDGSDPVCVNSVSDTSRESAIISITATDNRGVTSVSISWTGPGTDHGSGSMTRSGSVWKFTYTPSAPHTGTVTFSIQARDAAGNKSTVAAYQVQQLGCVG